MLQGLCANPSVSHIALVIWSIQTIVFS